jgi:hypothetical protein
MSKTKGNTATATEKTEANQKVPINRSALNDLAAYGVGEVETVSKRFIQAFPYTEKVLIGMYLGTHQMLDKLGNKVLGKQDKPFIVEKFMTADTGELVFLPRHGMLEKQLEKDTELGAYVYRLQYLGKREMPTGDIAHTWDITKVRAKNPIALKTMSASDAAVLENANDDLPF